MVCASTPGAGSTSPAPGCRPRRRERAGDGGRLALPYRLYSFSQELPLKRAVVVFSGGQDSTTCLVQALQQYDEVHCVTFDYGQRHRAEIDVARELALKLGAVAHKVLDVTLLNELAVSSLTRDNIPVPDYQPDAEGIPNTFVPGRNILFLTLTAIYAYQVKSRSHHHRRVRDRLLRLPGLPR